MKAVTLWCHPVIQGRHIQYPPINVGQGAGGKKTKTLGDKGQKEDCFVKYVISLPGGEWYLFWDSG